jgi:hypothetical protein
MYAYMRVRLCIFFGLSDIQTMSNARNVWDWSFFWCAREMATRDAPTRVVRIQRKGGHVVQGCDVYIGRACNTGGWDLAASKWANPYRVAECGTVEAAVEKYRQYIMRTPSLLNDIGELRGKTLGCWCKPGPCHGDVLVKLAAVQRDITRA